MRRMTTSIALRRRVSLALEAAIHSHEVDGSRSAMMDEAVEQALILAADALVRLRDVLAKLRVFDDRMSRNLQLTGGAVMAEAVMMALADSLGRQRAHDVVHHAATVARLVTSRSRARTSVKQVTALLDPSTHSGDSVTIARRTAERTRHAVNTRTR